MEITKSSGIRHSYMAKMLVICKIRNVFILFIRHKSDIVPTYIRHKTDINAHIPARKSTYCHSQILNLVLVAKFSREFTANSPASTCQIGI